MPFLTDFSLPADMDQFLGPSDASSLTIEAPRVEAAPRHVPRNDRQNRAEKRKAVENKAVKEEAVLKKMKPTRKERGQWREELGHVVERGVFLFSSGRPMTHVLCETETVACPY